MYFISRFLNKGIKKSKMKDGTGLKKTNLRTYTKRLKSIASKKHKSINLREKNNKIIKSIGDKNAITLRK